MRGYLLLLPVCALACAEPRSADPRPNVLLITVDTLRADHLGCYGYRLDTSPHIDGLAQRGVRFESCMAQWPKTLPSVGSLMTGLYPKTTGLRSEPRELPDSAFVLSELFASAGYTTAAVVANFNLGRTFGFDQGFDHFVESWEERWAARAGDRAYENRPGLVKSYTDAALVNEQAFAWLEDRDEKKPFFLWLHYMEPHGPYAPPEQYDGLFEGEYPAEPAPAKELPLYQVRFSTEGKPITDLAYYKARYDREVRHFDDELGRLLARFAELDLTDDTLIVFTADHGESLGEHGYYLEHGKLSYQATAHVPLIFVAEGAAAGRAVRRPVGLIDVAPTVLELAGVGAPPFLEGASLSGLVLGVDEDRAGGPVFMESGYDAERPQRVVRDGRWKLIQVLSPGDRASMTGVELELYDLEADPGETVNVATEHPELLGRLMGALEDWLASGLRTGEGKAVDLESLDPQAVEMLRALGYVE